MPILSHQEGSQVIWDFGLKPVMALPPLVVVSINGRIKVGMPATSIRKPIPEDQAVPRTPLTIIRQLTLMVIS